MALRGSELHALSAQRREAQLRRADAAERCARFFNTHGDAARVHEAWTANEYYDRANKDAELLAENKLKAAKLEERRKKLEQMLFQENLQFQKELKEVASKPKLFKNGSYLNVVPTSTLKDINIGIRAKEEELRQREAELRLYHAWRSNQPAIRDAESRIRHGALKSAWMDQIVEKELQKKKVEEDTKRSLKERDEYLKRQIQIEQERLKEKEDKMKELKAGLESQMSELSRAESAVHALRKQEEREAFVLEQFRFINEERLKQHERLAAERSTSLVNLALHRHRLKRRVADVMREIQLDIDMLQRLWDAVAEEYRERKEQAEFLSRVVDDARRSLQEQREQEGKRQQLIDSMFDGEARQINDKQDKLWAKEREARQRLMSDVIATLNSQVKERLLANREQQRQNVLERERILDDMEKYNREVEQKEKEKKYQAGQHGEIAALQCELKGLQLEASRLEEAHAQQAAVQAALQEEKLVQRELARAHRDGSASFGRNKFAW